MTLPIEGDYVKCIAIATDWLLDENISITNHPWDRSILRTDGGTAREAEQWYQFSAHARSWQQSSYFRKLALSTLSRSTTELTNCSDFLWGSLALMGRDVCHHTVSSLCHTVSHSLCHHITVYIESPTRIVPNPGCFRSFQGVRPNPNDASFGFDRVELSVEASMDNGSWELPAEGGQTYRKLGLEPFNLTGLPVRTAQNWLLWGHNRKMIYIYCITYIRYEEMLIHISHDTVPAPWFSRSKRQVLDSAFFVSFIAPDSDHWCLVWR